MKMGHVARRWALGIGGIALVGMGALTACGKDGSETPGSTTPPATSTTVPSTSGATTTVAPPTEKGMTPGGANSFSPTVTALPAPTALPGNRRG